MTKLTDNLWLGNSSDAACADLNTDAISTILNVAHDLPSARNWNHGIEYSQVGLVDGPGNSLAAYHAAVLKLAAFLANSRRCLCHCHEGRSTSAFCCIAVLHLLGQRRGWDHWHAFVKNLRPEVSVHEEHRRAFNRLNWRLLTSVMEG
jgi:hypothetical protein